MLNVIATMENGQLGLSVDLECEGFFCQSIIGLMLIYSGSKFILTLAFNRNLGLNHFLKQTQCQNLKKTNHKNITL